MGKRHGLWKRKQRKQTRNRNRKNPYQKHEIMNTTPFINVLKIRGFVPTDSGRWLSPDALRCDDGCAVEVDSKRIIVESRHGKKVFTNEDTFDIFERTVF
jgi:hypothetical protein